MGNALFWSRMNSLEVIPGLLVPYLRLLFVEFGPVLVRNLCIVVPLRRISESNPCNCFAAAKTWVNQKSFRIPTDCSMY